MNLLCPLCFGVAIGSTCCKHDFFFGKESFRYCKGTNVSEYSFKGAMMSAPFAGGISLVSILQAGDWARDFTPSGHYFSTYITSTDRHQDSVHCAALGLSE